MNRKHLREQIDSLIEGDISEADFLKLEAELSVDDELRAEYLDRVALTTLLQTEAEGVEISATPARVAMQSSTAEVWRYVVGGGIVLALCTVAFVVSRLNLGDVPAKNAVTEAQAAGYGIIRGQHDVVWNDRLSRAEGSLIPAGDMKLDSGIVQLELFSGVSVVVEGPAEFSITSPMNMVVDSGRVRAHVPEPAHGFKLSTRDGDIIDLGTDFAVDVSEGRSELHVIEGEVELRSRSSGARRLATGEAVSISGQLVSSVQADRERFVGQNEIVGRLQTAMKNRREDWLRNSEELRADPRLIALYQPGVFDLDDAWRADRRIANRANSDVVASEGAVVAADRTADRWQHRDGALDFSPTGSRVRLTIPGEYRSLTLMCWVKINSLDRWYNSLFLTDGHEQHEPHWQIMDDGRLFFSVKKRDQWDASKGEKDKHVYFSPPFWNTSLSGQWLMISTVYDVDGRLVRHYVNGKAISEEAMPDEYYVDKVTIGNASLCNWSLPTRRDKGRFAVRNLNGSLDEFALFNEALSSHEIQEMYEHGKP